jgi:hypothetical protein
MNCSLCKGQGHKSARCPELHEPLINDFYRGGGGASHSHDEEDAAISSPTKFRNSKPLGCGLITNSDEERSRPVVSSFALWDLYGVSQTLYRPQHIPQMPPFVTV